MSYQPKINDAVNIRDYKGVLHPLTIWVVKNVRPDLSLIFVPEPRINGIEFTNEQWIENDRLIKVHLPKTDQCG